MTMICRWGEVFRNVEHLASLLFYEKACILHLMQIAFLNTVEIDQFNRVGCAAVQLRLAYTTRVITVRDSLITRTVVDKVRRIGVLDCAAVGKVELARLLICEVVRCKRRCCDEQYHGGELSSQVQSFLIEDLIGRTIAEAFTWTHV